MKKIRRLIFVICLSLFFGCGTNDDSDSSDVSPIPYFLFGYPKSQNLGQDGFKILIRLNKAGKAYYVVLSNGSPHPSVSKVKDGSATNTGKFGTITVSNIAVDSFAAVAGLTTDTTYDVYLVAEDNEAAPHTQTSPTKLKVTTGTVQLSGKITYDYVPVSSAHKLDYEHKEQRPVRKARVQLIRNSDGSVFAGTSTDDKGDYLFTVDNNLSVKVRFFAETLSPSIVVEDNTNSDAVYAAESDAASYNSSSTLNLNAPSGWSGDNATGSYTTTRAAAPFAIMGSMHTAVKMFATARPAVSFPDLKVNWSVNNTTASGYGGKAAGHIGTSHWDGSELYILGKADVDTDEFDTHVVAHEWGHYFESKLGRSDSIGGQHSGGDILDPRVALGEGWGNALSAMVFSPQTEYRDTSGNKQQSGWGMDMESGTDSSPGWFSEISVQLILYDIFDPTDDTGDTVSLGIGPIYDVMVGAQKTTTALTTIFSFIKALKDNNSASSSAIDTLTQTYSIAAVSDVYGAGELLNDGGLANNLPVYKLITIGGDNVVLRFKAVDGSSNKLTENRFLKFTGNGGLVTVQSSCAKDVDLYVYQAGDEVAKAATASGSESVNVNTTNNVEYIIVVSGYDANVSEGTEYTADISVN